MRCDSLQDSGAVGEAGNSEPPLGSAGQPVGMLPVASQVAFQCQSASGRPDAQLAAPSLAVTVPQDQALPSLPLFGLGLLRTATNYLYYHILQG